MNIGLTSFRRLASPNLRTAVMSASSSTCVKEAKKETRKLMKDRLKAVAEQIMKEESRLVCNHILGCDDFINAETIGVYVHCDKLREVDTSALLSAALKTGKRCYVPVVEDKLSNMRLLHLDSLDALHPMPPYGILEPTRQYDDGSARDDAMDSQLHSLDMLLMPGLAFDRTGRRLGRGGGYYDKLLGRLKEKAESLGKRSPLLVALSFTSQLLEKVPVDEHDQTIDILVLPEGIVRCREN